MLYERFCLAANARLAPIRTRFSRGYVCAPSQHHAEGHLRPCSGRPPLPRGRADHRLGVTRTHARVRAYTRTHAHTSARSHARTHTPSHTRLWTETSKRVVSASVAQRINNVQGVTLFVCLRSTEP
eukprot:6181300-Pleurochrysis_carterae.AAC.2